MSQEQRRSVFRFDSTQMEEPADDMPLTILLSIVISDML